MVTRGHQRSHKKSGVRIQPCLAPKPQFLRTEFMVSHLRWKKLLSGRHARYYPKCFKHKYTKKMTKLGKRQH